MGHLVTVYSHGGRGKRALLGVFYKSTIPIIKRSHLPEAPPPNTITKEFRFQHINLERDTNIQSVVVKKYSYINGIDIFCNNRRCAMRYHVLVI